MRLGNSWCEICEATYRTWQPVPCGETGHPCTHGQAGGGASPSGWTVTLGLRSEVSRLRTTSTQVMATPTEAGGWACPNGHPLEIGDIERWHTFGGQVGLRHPARALLMRHGWNRATSRGKQPRRGRFAAFRTGSSTSQTTVVPGRYAGMTPPSRTTPPFVPLLRWAISGRPPRIGQTPTSWLSDRREGRRAESGPRKKLIRTTSRKSRGGEGGSGFSSTFGFGQRIPCRTERGHTSTDAREPLRRDLTAVRPMDGQ